MRRRLPLLAFTTVALATASVAGEPRARAATAWGDANLVRDDARVEIGRDGVATVTHVLALHVSGKKFRAFLMEGVDDGAEPPEDVATGLDGPGWPVEIEGTKGEKLDGVVEPTKEARKLRVHLGDAGVSRGDWTVRVRYRVDFAKLHLFARDDASLHFSWQGPHWPDGYDAGKVSFVLPSGLAEPRIGLADPAGGELGAQAVDGVALVAVQRGTDRDVLEITRPHVAHGDDATWIVHVDPRAMPEIAARLPRPERDTFRVGEEAQGIRAHLKWVLAAPGLGLLLGLVLGARDRGARRAAAAAGTELRPLVPMGDVARACGYGASLAAACVSTIGGHLYVASVLLVVAIALATVRPPLPAVARRPRGRWLAIPTSAIPRPRRPRGSMFDPATAVGAFLLVASVSAVVVGAAFVARTHVELAIVAVIHALALAPVFATGRVAQLPPDLARDSWPVLAPHAEALAAIPGVRARPIARLLTTRDDAAAPTSTTVDEVRVRLDVSNSARERGLVHLELGCAVVQGTGAAALVPELLVRVRDASDAAAALDAPIDAVPASATFAKLAGREPGERVFAIRPAVTSPAAMRRWVEWVLAVAGAPSASAPRISERAVLAAAAALTT